MENPIQEAADAMVASGYSRKIADDFLSIIVGAPIATKPAPSPQQRLRSLLNSKPETGEQWAEICALEAQIAAETPVSQRAYSEWCRKPSACAGKGYCPLDPTCAD